MNTKTNFYVFQYAGKEPALNRSDELEAYLPSIFMPAVESILHGL